jgi:hypothetical protein
MERISVVKVNRRFGEICCFHLQSQRESQASKKGGGCWVLDFLFDPENGGSTSLLNVRKLRGVTSQKSEPLSMTAVRFYPYLLEPESTDVSEEHIASILKIK